MNSILNFLDLVLEILIDFCSIAMTVFSSILSELYISNSYKMETVKTDIGYDIMLNDIEIGISN